MPTKTIIIADDHPLITEGIAALIQNFTSYEVVAITHNGKALLQWLNKIQPDLILLDINMPEMNGLEAATQIRVRFPKIKLVFISMYWELAIQEMLKKVNVDGFIPKLAEGSLFVATLKKIMEGEKIFLKSSSIPVDEEMPSDSFQAKMKLSKREMEIIRFIKNGLSTREVAEKLGLSVYTVDTHRKNICRKLGVSSPNALIKYVHQLSI